MDHSYLQLALFALASSITPGPNNLMLMASGANFGIVRTLPHWAGVCCGFVVLIVPVGLGLGAFVLDVPPVRMAFQLGCVAVLAWLGWKIASAGRPGNLEDSRRPLTFLQAAAFQWINPKAWTMGVSAISLFAQSGALHDILLVTLVFAAINMPSTGMWLVSGERVQRLLHKDSHFRAFNVAMGALLIACAIPVLLDGRGWSLS
jgi:threonine/homoserine/homoserine lactone efflux protein